MTEKLTNTLARVFADRLMGAGESVCQYYHQADNQNGKCGLRDYDVTRDSCKNPETCPVRLNEAVGALM